MALVLVATLFHGALNTMRMSTTLETVTIANTVLKEGLEDDHPSNNIFYHSTKFSNV